MSDTVLRISGVKKYFPVKKGIFGTTGQVVRAVDGVDLEVHEGETLGIVGESGCGKSTLARLIMKLTEPTEGSIVLLGKDLGSVSARELRNLRKDFQIVFQDPYASLNPKKRVRDILTEPYLIHNICGRNEAEQHARELLKMVGLGEEAMMKYPHEFSGGQHQRLSIARALALKPKLLVCDECVSALDVSIQAQIVNLLRQLQKELNLTMIFISHDLRIVQYISTTVAVMYLGRIVEYAPKEELFVRTTHPYSRALLSAVPIPDPTLDKKRQRLEGDLPSPIDLPSGCPFHTRCPYEDADKICETTVPPDVVIGEDHYCRCHFAKQIAMQAEQQG